MADVDLCIRGGLLYDGYGTGGRVADVAISGERIVAVGGLDGTTASREIDAQGLLVCPGFIDVHSHSDTYLLIEPAAPSKVFQGVTTEVVGNCGASGAPHEGAHRLPSDWAAQAYGDTWRSVAEYRALLEKARPAVNVALLVGHSNIRASVMGYAERPADWAEVKQMAAMLHAAFDQGAIGLSTGLAYTPGKWADKAELETLAAVAADHGGIYTSHMRNESRHLLAAIDEVLEIATSTGGRCQISHLKASGRDNWPFADAAIEKIEAARSAGLAITADRYPYTAGATELDIILPVWAEQGGRACVLARLSDEQDARRVAEALESGRAPDYWEGVMVGLSAANRQYQGMMISEIASRMGISPGRCVVELLKADQLGTGAFFFGMSAANMRKILSRPWVMIGSDASIRAPAGPLSHDHPHPRAYGTFTTLLREALDGRGLPLSALIHKMTLLPASTFGVVDRGIIQPGAYADLSVFAPDQVKAASDYGTPHVLSAGLMHQVVNGRPSVRNGRLTSERYGKVL